MSNPLHDALYSDYELLFGTLFDGFIGEAHAYAANEARWERRSPRAMALNDPYAYDRFEKSARRLFWHVAENALFAFPLPDIDESHRPLLMAAMDYGAAIAARDAILKIPPLERDQATDERLTAACRKLGPAYKVLRRAALDAFGFTEETPM